MTPEEADRVILRAEAKHHRCIVCDSDENTLISQHGALYCLKCFSEAHPRHYSLLWDTVFSHKPASDLFDCAAGIARTIVPAQNMKGQTCPVTAKTLCQESSGCRDCHIGKGG